MNRRIIRNRFGLCFTICLSITVCSCQKNKRIIEGLYSERDSLMTEITGREAKYNELSNYVETMALSLDSLNMAETTQLLSTYNEDGIPLPKNDIKRNLEIYEQILERQKSRIISLMDTLNTRNDQITKLNGIISFLTQELEEKENQIEGLKHDLEAKNRQVAKLNKDVSDLTETNRQNSELINLQETAIKTQDDLINTAYFCVGTKKELQTMGVITKALSPSLTISDYSKESFTSVDIRNFTELTIASRKIKILSPVAAGSYTIRSNPDKTVTVTITDPTMFWSLSNFLVVQTF